MSDEWWCNYCEGMTDHLSSAHPWPADCQPDACTEADTPMIARLHSPERCPAKPPTPCTTCGVVSEPNVRAVRLLTGD